MFQYINSFFYFRGLFVSEGYFLKYNSISSSDNRPDSLVIHDVIKVRNSPLYDSGLCLHEIAEYAQKGDLMEGVD